MESTVPAVMEAPAEPPGRATALPLPRFVSLKASKVSVRTGPAMRYPIKWIYKREQMPVEIVQEFDTWRKIRDFEGGEGWVHQSLLSGARTVMIKSDELVPMRKDSADNARVIARIEAHVIASVKECIPSSCEVDAEGFDGWVDRKFLWGIYESEELN